MSDLHEVDERVALLREIRQHAKTKPEIIAHVRRMGAHGSLRSTMTMRELARWSMTELENLHAGFHEAMR